MNYDIFLSWLIIILAITGSICWLIWAIRNKQIWGYSVAPLSYLTHILVFTVCRLFEDSVDVVFLNRWSSFIQVHSLIVLILAAIVMLFHPNREKMLEREIKNRLNGG